MYQMFNFHIRLNQFLTVLWLIAILIFLGLGITCLFRGESVGAVFSTRLGGISFVAAATVGGLLLVAVGFQDLISGQTSYTAKGNWVGSDSLNNYYELLCKTASFKESPIKFLAIVAAKGIAGVVALVPAIVFVASQMN